MASLDIESLFAKIVVEETINIILNDAFLTSYKVHNFERERLKELLIFEAYESFFIFDGEYYTQIDDVAGDPVWIQRLAMLFSVILKKMVFRMICRIFTN